MSEPSFTAGPWAVNEDDRSDMEWNREIVIAASPDDRICFMANGGDERADEYEANAHLIAAAPDLYAIAEMVIEFDGPGGTDSPMAQAARAALAKARGETP